MAKRWSLTHLVALTLLGCLVGTNVEAQGSNWQRPATSKGGSPPQNPKVSPQQRVPPLAPKIKPAPSPNIPRDPNLPKPPPKQNPQISHDQGLLQQKLLQPQRPLKPVVSKTSPYIEKNCEVARSVRITCGVRGISPAECEAIDCCYDGQECYFAKAVTLQCTKDGHFIVVVARDATSPDTDFDRIELFERGPGCTHVAANSVFAVYHFRVTACGTSVYEQSGIIMYRNSLYAFAETISDDKGMITRDTEFNLFIECHYMSTSVQAVIAEVLHIDQPPLPIAAVGPITVEMRLANGQCLTKGCNEVDAAYTSFYAKEHYPVIKVLREPVYVEVQLMGKTDVLLVLTLARCWATANSSPHSLPQWDLLIDGCPNRDDYYMSSLIPVDYSSGVEFPSHYRRFLFKMFTFLDIQKTVTNNEVYIHCSTAVCSSVLGYSCEPLCYRKKRHAEAADQGRAERKVVATVGPVIMNSPEQ